MKAITTQRMIEYFGPDIKRINHALKVYGFASCIAQRENLTVDEVFVVEIAAILHDVGIKAAEKKYQSSTGHYQEIEGPPIAKELLADFQLNSETLDRICHIIGNHHSYSKIDGPDFQIVVEADFLVNIFEDQIAKHSIESIRKKYFKTKTGLSILESIYLHP
jgi:CRISPR/Cas system-associated endonuclease Cas3-HD